MKELYWITRLDSVNIFLGIIIFLGILFCIAFTIGYFINCPNSENCDVCHKSYPGNTFWRNKFRKWALLSYTSLLISALMFIFIPNTKEAYMIYGVGTTVDYLRNDTTAVKLPHKAIEAIDCWVDRITESKNNNKNN